MSTTMALAPSRRRVAASLCHAALSILCAVCGPRSVAAEPVQQHEPVRLSVAGTPEEIGRAVGKERAAAVRALGRMMTAVAVVLTRQSKDAVIERAKGLAEKLSAEDREEIRGLAAGAGVAYEEALVFNLFYSLTNDLPGCRGLAAWGKATADGKLLHARNLDWPDYPGEPMQRHNLILNVSPKGGIEYLLLTWPGFQGALTGTNRKGVTVSFNQLPGGRERDAPLCEPVFFTLKRALRSSATADEAVKLLTETKSMGNGSILISDSSASTAVVVELIGGEVKVRKAEGEAIANANHPTREAGWEKLRTGSPGWPVLDAVREVGLPLDAAKAEKVMAHRSVLQEINLLSVVFEPGANRMLLSCGRKRAAEGTFTEHSLFPEDTKPD